MAVALDEHGQKYNVNADTAAAALAIELGAVKLVLLTDVAGLYPNWSGKDAASATQATTISPQSGSGMPITAASRIAGCVAKTASTSSG